MVELGSMYSFVIPLFNEEESIQELFQEIKHSSDKLNYEYEVLFIDDGSTDKSLTILKKLSEDYKRVRIFSFRKNQGKAEALMLGFQKAKGDIIVTLDADLQDKPKEIQKLVFKLKNGFDAVSGWRKDRHDSPFKIFSSKLFNWVASKLWGLKLHDYNCGLKVYTQEAAKSLSLYGGMHRFIPLILFQQGFNITEVPVKHEARKFGKSKFGLSKVWKDLPDIFTMLFLSRYGSRPLHFFGTIGGILFLAGFLISLYLSIIHFQGQAIGRRPLLFLGILLIMLGVQIFFTGFLADLILNISQKSNNNSLDSSLKYSSDSKITK